MMTGEVNAIEKSIEEKVKLWDARLVNLRKELNIESVLKRIGDKADTFTVSNAIE